MLLADAATLILRLAIRCRALLPADADACLMPPDAAIDFRFAAIAAQLSPCRLRCFSLHYDAARRRYPLPAVAGHYFDATSCCLLPLLMLFH